MTEESSQARSPADPPTRAVETAERLHSAAIHLLRRLRRSDAETGLTASRLSALSVIVYAGPLPVGELAAAEQVRPPTMSRLVADLEREGLVLRRSDPHDGRVHLLEATAKGRALLERGRRLRVRALAGRVASLDRDERELLSRAAALLETLALPDDHPAVGE